MKDLHSEYHELLDLAAQKLPSTVIINSECKIVFMNQSYCRFLGVDYEDTIGKHVADVIPGTLMPEIIKIAAQMFIENKGNYISFKINMLKVKENKMTIQINLLMNGKEIETNESNPKYSFMTLEVRKITNHSTFILQKFFLDFPLPSFVTNSIKKFMTKYIERIKKLLEIAKKKFDY